MDVYIPECIKNIVNRTYLTFVTDCMTELEPVQKLQAGVYVG